MSEFMLSVFILCFQGNCVQLMSDPLNKVFESEVACGEFAVALAWQESARIGMPVTYKYSCTSVEEEKTKELAPVGKSGIEGEYEA